MSLREGYAADIEFKRKLKAMPKPKRSLVSARYTVFGADEVRATLLGYISGHMDYLYDFYRVVYPNGSVRYAFISSVNQSLCQTWTPESMSAPGCQREPFTTALRLINDFYRPNPA